MIEVTIVAAIMAFLAAMIGAVMQAPKLAAQKAICENNMRQQVTYQLTYATDSHGKFAPFAYNEPWTVRDASISSVYLRIHELYKPYFGEASVS